MTINQQAKTALRALLGLPVEEKLKEAVRKMHKEAQKQNPFKN